MVAPVVVLAGGLGTRLLTVTNALLPKALAPIGSRPFIDFKLRGLARMGATEVVLLVGEHGDQLIEHVGDGARFGVDVAYVPDGATLLGTAGAVRNALPQLPARFWITYGDTYVVADLKAAETELSQRSADGIMCVLANEDRWEPSNVDVTEGRVSEYRKGAPRGEFRWIDYGLLLMGKNCFEHVSENEPTDLNSVLQELIARRALLAWEVNERFWEVGTPEALAETAAHFEEISLWDSLR